MPEFDKNAAYIWACYAIGAVLILGLTLQIILAARATRKRLEKLEPGDSGEA